MPHSLLRKRQFHAQNETCDLRAEEPASALLSGKQFRLLHTGLMRRIRLLCSLLRRYPAVIVFLLMITWVGVRVIPTICPPSFRSRSALEFRHEITKRQHVSLLDDELVEGFDSRHLERLSNFRETLQGCFMDVQLKDARKGVVKVLTSEQSQNSYGGDRIPRVYRLGKLLHLESGFAVSYSINLPIVLQEPLADRHTAKALYRACGFRSYTKVTDGATVVAHIVLLTSNSFRAFPALHMPTIEPYEWESNLPSSLECERHGKHHNGNNTIRQRCRRMTEVMIVMYLAGCAPPDNDAFIQWEVSDNGDTGMFEIAFPRACFMQDQDSSVLLDILLAFVGRTCSLPSGLLGVVKQLSNVGWGVGQRARMLEKRVVILNDQDAVCQNRGWTFYSEGSET